MIANAQELKILSSAPVRSLSLAVDFVSTAVKTWCGISWTCRGSPQSIKSWSSKSLRWHIAWSINGFFKIYTEVAIARWCRK